MEEILKKIKKNPDNHQLAEQLVGRNSIQHLVNAIKFFANQNFMTTTKPTDFYGKLYQEAK